jgi:hypothetical protein
LNRVKFEGEKRERERGSLGEVQLFFSVLLLIQQKIEDRVSF